METKKTVAERLFDFTALMAEDEIIDKVWNELGDDNFGNWYYDYYDCSFEFCGCKPEFRLSENLIRWFWSEGFHVIWLLHEDRMETEYNSLKDTAEIRRPLSSHHHELVESSTMDRRVIATLHRENIRLRAKVKELELTHIV